MPLEFQLDPGKIFADDHKSPLSASDVEKMATPKVRVQGELDDLVIPITKPEKIKGDIPSEKIVNGSISLSQIQDGFLYHDGKEWKSMKSHDNTYMTIKDGLPVWNDIGNEEVIVGELTPPPGYQAAVKEDGFTPIWVLLDVDFVRIPVNESASKILDAGDYFVHGSVRASGEGVAIGVSASFFRVDEDSTEVQLTGQGIVYAYNPIKTLPNVSTGDSSSGNVNTSPPVDIGR